MGKKSKQADRITAIQNFFRLNPKSHRNTLYRTLNQYPSGTLSYDLHCLSKTGDLIAVGEGRWELPTFIRAAHEIAQEIKPVKRKAVRNLTIFDKSTNDNLQVEQAITLLKKNGYRVYKSVTKLEEV